jgi:hypothetical protein
MIYLRYAPPWRYGLLLGFAMVLIASALGWLAERLKRE